MTINPLQQGFISVWLTVNDVQPTVCCTCGMYTDKHVQVRYRTYVTTEKESGGLGTVFGIILSLFLGPIGWLITGLSSESSNSKSVKQTFKIKMAQCPLCKGQEPIQAEDYRVTTHQFEFLVHPEFAKRLAADNLERTQRSNMF